MVTRSKLTLNRNNNDYFQIYLVPLGDSLPKRGFWLSEHLLRKAFEWFDKQVSLYIKDLSETDRGQALAQLERILVIIFFYCYHCCG